jgi:hypothetical protein
MTTVHVRVLPQGTAASVEVPSPDVRLAEISKKLVETHAILGQLLVQVLERA